MIDERTEVFIYTFDEGTKAIWNITLAKTFVEQGKFLAEVEIAKEEMEKITEKNEYDHDHADEVDHTQPGDRGSNHSRRAGYLYSHRRYTPLCGSFTKKATIQSTSSVRRGFPSVFVSRGTGKNTIKKGVAMPNEKAHELWSSVRGNEHVLRALEVAFVGDHSVMFIGPPGCGKSLFCSIMMESNNARHAKMTPCLCGWYQDLRQTCSCSVEQIAAAQGHLQRETLRFDIIMHPSRPKFEDLFTTKEEKFEHVWDRVLKAKKKEVSTNLSDGGKALLKSAWTRLYLTPGDIKKVLAVAVSIAKLDSSTDRVDTAHIAEAIQYRHV